MLIKGGVVVPYSYSITTLPYKSIVRRVDYMYQKCRYLRQRTKKGELYYYCAKRRETVNFACFRECLDKEYKEQKKLVAKKPIKSVSELITKHYSIIRFIN